MIARSFTRIVGLALLLLSVAAGPATASTASDSKIVGNVQIYLGVLPAEMIRGHPPAHTESTMHGARPAGESEYHVTIALFDATTGERITGADVRARVAEIGLAGEEKKLQPMEIAGTETYGNYFPMVGNGPFRIVLTIRPPRTPRRNQDAVRTLASMNGRFGCQKATMRSSCPLCGKHCEQDHVVNAGYVSA